MTETTHSRRALLRAGSGALAALALGTGTATALPGKPSFAPSLYGDGEAWGTKGAAVLPAPTDHNEHSYDKLFAITNGADGQLPVAEAAPGNPSFNGGRWFTHTVRWTESGMSAHDPLPMLTRYGPDDEFDSIQLHHALGHLEIVPGAPDGSGTPDYFECPMLPVKD